MHPNQWGHMLGYQGSLKKRNPSSVAVNKNTYKCEQKYMYTQMIQKYIQRWGIIEIIEIIEIIDIIDIIKVIYWQKCSKSEKVGAAAGPVLAHHHYKSSCRS